MSNTIGVVGTSGWWKTVELAFGSRPLTGLWSNLEGFLHQNEWNESLVTWRRKDVNGSPSRSVPSLVERLGPAQPSQICPTSLFNLGWLTRLALVSRWCFSSERASDKSNWKRVLTRPHASA